VTLIKQIALPMVVGVLLIASLVGCSSQQDKQPNPDAAKQEADELKKNLQKEWGR
jgi:uncharacterized lipoprotein